jgi:type IV pilus assembly protein PilM
MVFQTKPQHVIGLDIGTGAVKMVQLAKHGQHFTAVAGAHAPLTGAPGDPEATVRAITECYRALGSKDRNVVCGLAGATLAVREFNFPSLPPEEAEQAVILEAELASPLDISQSVVDYQLAGASQSATATAEAPPTTGATGVFAIAAESLVQQTMDLVNAAGLNCVLMDVASLALLNCVDGCDQVASERSTCVIDVGASTSQIALWDPARSPCVRDLSHGVARIIQSLIDQGVSPDEAAECFRPGSAGASTDGALAVALERACVPLAVEINSTLRFYMGQGAAAPVAEARLCGGLALSEAAMAAIRPALVVSTTPWSPYSHIRVPDSATGADIFHNSGPSLAVATGLAMRAI